MILVMVVVVVTFGVKLGLLVVGGCKNSQMRELQVLRVRYTCGQVISKYGNKLRSQLKVLALLLNNTNVINKTTSM